MIHAGDITPTKETSFTKEGFRNWKHAVGAKEKGLFKHNVSFLHILAMAKWEEHKKRAETGSSVSTLVNDRQLERNWYYVTSVVKIIQFLASNNLALRGSRDKIYQEETGLFSLLLQYTIEKDAVLN